MAFDDILEPKTANYDEGRPPRSVPKAAPSKPAPSIQSLLGDADPQQIAKRLGLNDDLTKQVIVPLLAILDKHGTRFIDADSPTTQTISSVGNIVSEFGPLIQGAYQYFSGVKTQLDAADAQLLEANAAALSASELNSLFGTDDDISHEQVKEPVAVASQPKPKSFGPDGSPLQSAPASFLQAGKVDYYALLSGTPSLGGDTTESDFYSQQQVNNEMKQQASSSQWKTLPAKSNSLVNVDTLASENGLTSGDVRTGDKQYLINGGDPTDKSINLQSASNVLVDEGKNDILAAMRSERNTRKMESVDPSSNPTMSSEELVNHIKTLAKPGAGGQSTTDAGALRRKSPFNLAGLAESSKNAFNIEGAEELVSNAFTIDGLAEAMSQERQSLKTDTKEYKPELQSQTNSLESNNFDSSWDIGSLNDLTTEDIGIEDISLKIPELDVSFTKSSDVELDARLSEDITTPDSEALNRTPKRNQFRSSTLKD